MMRYVVVDASKGITKASQHNPLGGAVERPDALYTAQQIANKTGIPMKVLDTETWIFLPYVLRPEGV